MAHRLAPWPLVAVALMSGGCSVVSSPPKGAEAPPPVTVAAPQPRPAEAPPPKTVKAPPPKPVEAPPPKLAEAPLPKTVEAPPPKPVAPPPPSTAPAPKAPPKAEARAATPVSRPAPSASAAAPAPAPPLDLKSLEQRLKESSAIGLLTKLSLKNQVDDLVAKFRAFHGGQRPPGLAELRPSFELLLMKVLSLLQDKDPGLAKDIEASRNAIWQMLTDRDKLASQS